jgi:hypothetical protein
MGIALWAAFTANDIPQFRRRTAADAAAFAMLALATA